MPIIVGAICYILCDDKVLLARRTKSPHIGLWTAPGGKIEFGESPSTAIIREIEEETGISIDSPILHGTSTIIDKVTGSHWLIFIYSIRSVTANECNNPSEMNWFSISELADIDIPKADRAYLNYVLSSEPSFEAQLIIDKSSEHLCITPCLHT